MILLKLRGTASHSDAFKCFAVAALVIFWGCSFCGGAEQTIGDSDPGSKTYFPRPFAEDQKEEPTRELLPRTIFLQPPSGDKAAKEKPSLSPLPSDGSAIGLTPTEEGKETSILGVEEMEIARHAWKYFTANYLPATGMVNPIHHYSRGTLWDAASVLASYVSAEKLGLIDRNEFYERTARLLKTFLSLDLYRNEVPNREYDWQSATIVGLKGEGSLYGSGWSALDLGRMLIWLKITESWYPDLSEITKNIVRRWKFERVCLDGRLNGVLLTQGRENLRQEGRFGYEQYAAAGYVLWDKQVDRAFSYENSKWVELEGIRIPVDTRNYPYLTSEPFFLARIELGGLDQLFGRIIDHIYEIQKRRWQRTGILTAVSEDAVDVAPWFVYNCLYYEGIPWACVDHRGRPCNRLKSLSSKAALAWAAIYSDTYSRELRKKWKTLVDADFGFYGGIYERSGNQLNRSRNANTNAVILEAMLYLKKGRKPFLSFRTPAM